MKQLVIRSISGAPGIFDVASGILEDGSFRPIPYAEIPDEYRPHVVESDLLGTQGYVRAMDLSPLLLAILSDGGQIAFYPNFLVLNIPENESKEEEDAQ